MIRPSNRTLSVQSRTPELLCERCWVAGARTYEDLGAFCREHRPRPSPADLIEAARQALDEGRLDDLRRLLRLLVEDLLPATRVQLPR